MYYRVVSADDICHHGIKGMRWGVRRYQNKDGSLTAAGKKRYNSEDLSNLSDEELRKRLTRANIERAYKNAVVENERYASGRAKRKDVLETIGAGAAAAQSLATAGSKSGKVISETKTAQVIDNLSGRNLRNKASDFSTRSGQGAAILKESGNISKNVGKLSGKDKQIMKKIDLSGMSDKELSDKLNRINMERSYRQMMFEQERINSGRASVKEVLQDIGTLASTAASIASIALVVNTILKSK